jgi:hypothetical protein
MLEMTCCPRAASLVGPIGAAGCLSSSGAACVRPFVFCQICELHRDRSSRCGAALFEPWDESWGSENDSGCLMLVIVLGVPRFPF